VTSPLAILERTFRPIDLPARPPEICDRCNPPRAGVYLLVATPAAIVYVGSSGDVESRLWSHVRETEIGFDRALWLALPAKVLPHYEGALIRALAPRLNRVAPKYLGYDNEILDGFGLPTHDDPHANALAWQTFRVEEPQRDPGAFGRLLKSWIDRRRTTVSALARAVGVSRQAVHCWLSGTTFPTTDRMEDLAAALGLTVAEFYGGAA